MSEADQTRELEREIEAYPGPRDGMPEGNGAENTADTRIPEQINPAPRKPGLAPGAPSMKAAQAGASRIEPSEVQRVFGSDVNILALSSLQPAQVTRLQVRLRELGHYQGVVDGVAGPQTRAALQAYARAQFNLKQRLLEQNQLTTDMAEQLGVQEGPLRELDPTFRDGADSPRTPSNTGPGMRRGAPLLPPGGAPMSPPGVTPLPPSGGPPMPTPSSAPSPSRGPTPAASPTTPPSP